MLKYCSGKLTDTNKLKAVFKFQVIKKYLSEGKDGVKENLNNIPSGTFERDLRRVSQIELMCIVCWLHGTQTHEQSCFFVVKNLIGKMTHGRCEQISKIWNYQK